MNAIAFTLIIKISISYISNISYISWITTIRIHIIVYQVRSLLLQTFIIYLVGNFCYRHIIIYPSGSLTFEVTSLDTVLEGREVEGQKEEEGREQVEGLLGFSPPQPLSLC